MDGDRKARTARGRGVEDRPGPRPMASAAGCAWLAVFCLTCVLILPLNRVAYGASAAGTRGAVRLFFCLFSRKPAVF